MNSKNNTKLYAIWDDMIQRCYNPSHPQYAEHGGRGITVCDEWRNDFKAFEKWSYENGYKEGMTL